MKVALIQGGKSSEREVSLKTGQAFAQALTELGFEFESFDADESLLANLPKGQFDVALLAVHGRYGEDGIVQSVCELIGLPYTGSGVMASAIAMDKILTKQILQQYGLATPAFVEWQADQAPIPSFDSWPKVVKPSREGSSVGISIVNNNAEMLAALKLAASYDFYVLIEDFIDGPEITVPIVGDEILPAIEIRPLSGWYDYKNKYTAGNTEYLLPAPIPSQVMLNINQMALKAFKALRLRGYARVDFRVDKKTGAPMIIEVNTLPGCTPTSLLPKSAAHYGWSFTQLVQRLLNSAELDYA